MADDNVKLTVVVDRDSCVGAGMCVRSAPEIFSQDDDEGLVLLLDAHPAPELQDKLTNAISLCPARVISVRR